ncbi:glutaminase [Kutzneria albida]|uniref:Glutaminase n=1 Tax=Kutzneria albida DSM 43870 TaxID=1449976 RepID=W5WBU2_9PSEU|nr:glutaminase [Kutzneria albida]AHH95659.1 Glutaminase [Kutzneria albida DSM 43870]
MDYQGVLTEIAASVKGLVGSGQVADYIPALSSVDPDQFGIAVADVHGEVHGVGDWQVPFSVQSVSKPFALALALAHSGEGIWRRVGREPSGTAFNSLVQLEHEHGVPRNPFINAGALVITDHLVTTTGDAGTAVLDLLRAESGNPHISVDEDVAISELANADRNAALAHLMASYGNMENPVPVVLENYFWQCAVRMSCRDLATAGLFLAREGVRADGSRLLSGSLTKRVNSVMLTCGTYDAAGDFAYRVGLPGKSGVGGGILAVIPNRCALCVWSPGLDARGNSVAGVAALEEFTTLTGWSVF